MIIYLQNPIFCFLIFSFRKTWDPFMLKTINNEEEITGKSVQFLQYIICFLFGVAVLGFAFLSKVSKVYLDTNSVPVYSPFLDINM